MNEVKFGNRNEKWYTIEELAELTGLSIQTLKGGHSPLLDETSIGIKTESRLGGYHNTQRFYSPNVLKALKQYQLRNSAPNALQNKETAISGNISFTIGQTIDSLMNNPETLELLYQKSIERARNLGIENKQLKDVIESQKPKVEIYEKIANGSGCFTINQTAKALKLPYGNITLFEKLRRMGILNSDNSPKQEQINAGHFKVVVKFINDNIGNKSVTLTTGKGLVYLAKKFRTEIDESVKADA